ncbi:hypothetical protein FH972_000321 [Carpinus fangiana]|uniref:Disease resistance R13L4/SHOC-2-like LRR domain-containing protein n=1 Tax=Carpinus fangiana TaxID=176857 RepID=A0A5N6QBE6_9ROSI|nr:hypothetical protein FH972_000321 [Carpinus fangiana]
MPSSDQSSGAGSVEKSKDSVISDVVGRLKEAKDFLSKNRPPVSSDTNSGNNNGDSGNDGSSHSSQFDYLSMENQAEKLSKDLIYIGESFKSLKGFEVRASDLLEKLELHSSGALGTSVPNVSLRPKQLRAKLRAIDKIVMELKLRIPLPYKLSSDKSDAHRYTRGGTEFDDLDVIDDLPVLHVDMGFRNSLAFQDFRSVYESLDSTAKLCLLCFALIPENEIVKKRFMTYWWVGEGFVSPEVDDGTLEERRSVEEVADEIFEKLAKKHCIEPINEKHRFVVDSYKMNPFIRSGVIVLAKEAGLFDFDDKKGYPTTNFETSHRAYLVDGFSQELVKFFNESATEKRGAESDLEKLQTIFNVNEPYPDFFKSEWFSKLKNVKVLYLGRWQTSAKHHIEVESTEFLTGLKSMKLLRFFSLQGISRITKLPDSVCKLLNLRILDLRACHTLEELPDGIGSLENLTHLDISECYLLEYIPKKIKLLSKLRVLKGFVIGGRRSEKSCTLADLSGLKELRKLSIYTNTKDFPNPNEDDVIYLQKFENLEKLTIEWGAFPSNTGSDRKGEPPSNTTARLAKTLSKTLTFKQRGQGPIDPKGFKKLKKLDLKCYPSIKSPRWLLPGKFLELEKLYIRGGNLQNLSPGQENAEWKVNILRLKFLSNLKMDWKELLSSFPHLIYLEKYKCPKLTFFPCNENGIVLKPITDAGKGAAARYNLVH